ncbi:G protein-regulated inducer of neurite outgrowth 2 [Hyla sarda]|uniref:G protein-regulated inducer of neurite outgrowth 2 n=1 Tax=Hyla sarda TaxID=327740 RepID=UPI0024C44233|nr:G protein-regulated inducer of neurite outgrowth 2 [Hyla sarda]XP_056386875.1 G protein-regulated inducer of neurite outgrowth 2 [Hyla sarda]XP_056386876.1 G protein-regulated inducer of neurite outgrowth 2 [Hyla sarda]XP_056386877.1 G protein-regulated inducer of neurite outgrowth 2 [Hyla sarda]XP_056386878.1 G protein-regulated inducer of neurite outgrowth 2 [Hyla sarda]XP_056386879.1 G protein-regulated inducer of neurite outgrowth 2 [Hyla sarda]XP_056386880.1 G protein-regulated induce
MASGDQNLSSPTCQGPFHVFCQEKTNCRCHSLSKSSSALPSSGVGGLQKKPVIHKSLNSINDMAKGNEKSNVQQSHSSEWSTSKDCPPDPNLEKSDCNHLSVGHLQEKIYQKIHYRSAESSLATSEQEVTKGFVRYNVSENVSLLGHSEILMCKADSMDTLDLPGTIVQKSYSDYFGGRRISVPHSVRENIPISATCSNLSACSSISGSGSDRTCTLSIITQDSGIVHSPSNVHNNLSDAFFEKEQTIPLSHLDSSTIQNNITVYTVPGSYQHGTLGSRNSGKGFPNNDYVYCQPRYSIPGIMSCDNISETKLSPPAMIIHNSCSVHCSKGHEPLMKVDDTIAAYCHSLPIPSIQYSSGLVHSLGEPVLRQTLPQYCTQFSHPDKFSFPKLVSSVSESGLDTKKLIRCGRLAFPPPPVSIGEMNCLASEINTSDLLLKTVETPLDVLEIPDSCAKTKDTWTMTSKNFLSLGQKNSLSCKDAEVQCVIIMESKAVSTTFIQSSSHSHLFPDVGLGISLQCPQTPVREVRYDEEGMTWEVYGAAVDPEVLGLAIQKHLEIQIEQNTQPSEQSGEIEQPNRQKRRSIRTVMQCLRQSNCCVCNTTTTD